MVTPHDIDSAESLPHSEGRTKRISSSVSFHKSKFLEGSLIALLRTVWRKRDLVYGAPKAQFQYRQLTRLWRFVKPYRRTGIISSLLAILGALLAAPQPLISKFLVDNVIHRGRMDLLLPLIILLVALILGATIVGFHQVVAQTRFQMVVLTDIQETLFSRVVKLPKSFFDSKQTGYLMSRIMQDTGRFQTVLTGGIVQMLPHVLLMPAAVVLLFWLNWRLTLVVLVLIPMLAYIAKGATARARTISSILMEQSAQVYRNLGSTLSTVSLIKTSATESQERQKFSLKLRESAEAVLQQRVLSTSLSLLLSLSGSAAVIVCTWVGVWDVHLAKMTLGDYVAFCAYMGYLLGPLSGLATMHVEVQAAMVAMDRILELLDSVPEDADDDGKVAIGRICGAVEARNVCFSYDGDRHVLEDVSFVVLPGQVVAIVGASGSGKSTLVSLLLRLYRPTSGHLLIDGHDVEELKLQPLRERIGIVSQDVVLVDDSIVNNIRYGAPDATSASVEQAARLACAEEFILGFPNGYQTMVGEHGVKLSAGQRQRISLARVLVKDPDIIILDEPTSALDSITERAIKSAVFDCPVKKTTFIIAHRLSTIVEADRIFVLANGGIRQAGTHAELIRKEGLYRRMCEEQNLITSFGEGDDYNSADSPTQRTTIELPLSYRSSAS